MCVIIVSKSVRFKVGIFIGKNYMYCFVIVCSKMYKLSPIVNHLRYSRVVYSTPTIRLQSGYDLEYGA